MTKLQGKGLAKGQTVKRWGTFGSRSNMLALKGPEICWPILGQIKGPNRALLKGQIIFIEGPKMGPQKGLAKGQRNGPKMGQKKGPKMGQRIRKISLFQYGKWIFDFRKKGPKWGLFFWPKMGPKWARKKGLAKGQIVGLWPKARERVLYLAKGQQDGALWPKASA